MLILDNSNAEICKDYVIGIKVVYVQIIPGQSYLFRVFNLYLR